MPFYFILFFSLLFFLVLPIYDTNSNLKEDGADCKKVFCPPNTSRKGSVLRKLLVSEPLKPIVSMFSKKEKYSAKTNGLTRSDRSTGQAIFLLQNNHQSVHIV